jgi:PAS domain S-box-containing protein
MKFYPEKLIAYLEQQRTSITKFAKKVGVSRNTVYCWKNGSATPGEALVRDIARYLNIKVGKISDLKELLKSDSLSESIDIIDLFQKNDEVEYYVKQYEQLSLFLTKSKNEVLRVNVILKALFSSIKSHLYIKDVNLNYVMGNDTFKKSLNILKSNIHGMSDHELYPGKIAGFIKEKDLKVLEQGIDQIGEESTIPGTTIPCLESRYLIRDKADTILGLAGVYENISTLKKRIRTDTIKTELINITDEAIWLAKIKRINNKLRFKVFYNNRARYKLFDVLKAPFIFPKNWTDCIHDDDREKVLKAIEKQNKIDNSRINLSYRIILPDKTIKYISEKRFTFTIGGDSYAGGMQHDMSEIINAETENMALKYCIDNSNMLCYTGRSIHNSNKFIFEYVNSASEEVLGLTEEEFRKDIWGEIIAEDSKGEYVKYLENKKNENYRNYQFHIKHKIKNELRWINLRTEVTRGKDKDYHIGYFHDITEKKKQEDIHRALLSVHDNSKDAVWIKTLEKVIYANDAAKKLYGYDIVGSEMLPIMNVNIPDYTVELDGKECDLMDILCDCESKKTDETVNFTHKHEIIKDNNKIIYCESTYQFQRRDEYIQIFCSTRNVTKEKKERRENQLLRKINDNKKHVVWFAELTSNESGNDFIKMLYINNAVEEFYGVKKESLYDVDKHLLRNQILEIEGKYFVSASTEHSYPCEKEYRVINRATNEIRWILDRRDRIGQIYSGEMFDITAKKNETGELELIYSMLKYSDYVFFVEKYSNALQRGDGKYYLLSDSIEKLTGYPKQVFMDDPTFYFTLVHHEDLGIVSEEMKHINNTAYRYRIKHKDGAIFNVEERIFTKQINKEKFVCGLTYKYN